MLNNNYLGFEELHQCSICHEPVSNPLCPICITTQIESWLTYYPNGNQIKEKLIPKIQKYIQENLREGTQCIKCNKERASICSYCFTKFILKELHKLEVSHIVIKEFLQFFNLWEHSRYEKLKTKI